MVKPIQLIQIPCLNISVNSGLKLIWSELLNIVNICKINISHTDFMHNNTHRRRSNADLSDLEESCEMYLMRVLTNPLSLKQLSRIAIRNRIIENMNDSEFVKRFVLTNSKYQLNSALEFNSPYLSVVNANANANATTIATLAPNRRLQQTCSILECLIWQLDLPRILHFYLYAFPDVPPMPENIAIFVND